MDMINTKNQKKCFSIAVQNIGGPPPLKDPSEKKNFKGGYFA